MPTPAQLTRAGASASCVNCDPVTCDGTEAAHERRKRGTTTQIAGCKHCPRCRIFTRRMVPA